MQATAARHLATHHVGKDDRHARVVLHKRARLVGGHARGNLLQQVCREDVGCEALDMRQPRRGGRRRIGGAAAQQRGTGDVAQRAQRIQRSRLVAGKAVISPKRKHQVARGASACGKPRRDQLERAKPGFPRRRSRGCLRWAPLRARTQRLRCSRAPPAPSARHAARCVHALPAPPPQCARGASCARPPVKRAPARERGAKARISTPGRLQVAPGLTWPSCRCAPRAQGAAASHARRRAARGVHAPWTECSQR